METIVALDIETTGLDAEKDAIIEIGAVRFKGHRVEDEWTTLIHPGRRIPPFITQLTGITDQMILQSPSIQEVLPGLSSFAGGAPILGHNVRFDLGFLRRYAILRSNPVIDTYEMASVLLPNAGRYNLGSLTQALGVLTPATHRALDDARATRGVFLRLYEEILAMPLPLLAEIIHQAEGVDWQGYWPFRWALRERSKEVVSSKSIQLGYSGPLFNQGVKPAIAPLQAREQPLALDTEEVASILEPGGLFAHYFPNFEFRSQQVEMLRAVTDALNEGRHLMVEAGTGTGKSMAYLIPAALWAIENGCRVIISTNTINLQDQLINKDIPDLRQALGMELNAVVLKGRGNYLCPRRLENLRRHGPETPEEMRLLGKVLVWMQGTLTGDRAELNLNGPAERQLWGRLSSEDEACTSENCLKHTGGACPFYRVRQAAQAAHILIVNHALLLSDVATGNRVLPEYNYLIIDEAHHLEDATTSALSFHITYPDIERMLRALGGPNNGLLGRMLSAVQSIYSPGEYAGLNQQVNRIADLVFRFENLAREFFQAIDRFLREQREGGPMTMYSQQVRIIEATRSQPAWEEVELVWDEAQSCLRPMMEMLGKAIQELGELQDDLAEGDEEIYTNLATLFRRLAETDEHLSALVFKPSDEQIYWAEVSNNGYQPSLHAAPLHIGPLMQKYLWNEKTAVVLTSATLTAAGQFEYLKGRLSAQEAEELALGSPFDYETAAMLYLANDIPEPSDRNGHQRGIETALIRLAQATNGRTLVLFTSYDQLRRTSQAISAALAKAGITVYEQGDGASPHTLLETFRANPKAVLLGTRSFWEGVDIPGDALSVVVIVKLPFDVPSDPIIAARSETFEDPFSQYSLPEAILRFRQGFGRLIRTQFDHGIVAVLDRRVLTKRYGKLFLDSLPPCTVKIGPLADLPKQASQWLNL